MTDRLSQGQFCSVASSAASEPLAGTGAHPSNMILIRWPKAKWEHSMRIAQDMPEQVRIAINTAANMGWRINLIDRKGEDSSFVRIYVMPAAMEYRVDVALLPDLLDSLCRDIPTEHVCSVPIPKTVLLCCTHGKHDRCCAKFGFAAYCALRDAGRGAGVSVWECTHLGVVRCP